MRYRETLRRCAPAALMAIRRELAPAAEPVSSSVSTLIDEIAGALDHSRDPVAGLPPAASEAASFAASLFAITETSTISLAGLRHALGALGFEPDEVISAMLERGLLAVEPNLECPPVEDFRGIAGRCDPCRTGLTAHPAVVRDARTPRLRIEAPTVPAERVGGVRETDGLDPMLRLGALWQLVAAAPLRWTQQGKLYKRDRERLSESPVLNAAGSDSPIEVANLPALWLALGARIGLIETEESGDRYLAGAADFWVENAVHLHQMIATGWLGLYSWQEVGTEEAGEGGPFPTLAVGYIRLPILIRIGSLPEGAWIAIDDLAAELDRAWNGWDRLTLQEAPGARFVGGSNRRAAKARKPSRESAESPSPIGIQILESILLDAAYRMGLVRIGEEALTRRRVVQLTSLGRYALLLGPPPPPGPVLDQFLFVQPNFELIAYRQGLTPRLIGRLSRFAQWSNVGAAIELKLTNESVVLGLDGGLSPAEILETLARHSSRPLPTGVVDAVKGWASRRDRITCHANATLIEFGSRRELEQAMELWPAGVAAPTPVSDNLLLVEDERSIPFDRLRLTGSRDYRLRPEICVTVDPDGVALSLDRARADLLIDAELGRFADEEAGSRGSADRVGTRSPSSPRRYLVTPGSIDRAIEAGMTEEQFEEWYLRRTGRATPPAVWVMLLARLNRVPKLNAARFLVVTAPSEKVLDGLLQHPETRDLFEDRIGGGAAVVAEADLPRLAAALEALGIALGGRLDSSPPDSEIAE